jgi:hypothetical protein
MNHRQKNQIATAATIIGMIDLIIKTEPCKTVEQKTATLRTRAQAILADLPDATDKEVRSITRRIGYLRDQIPARRMTGIAVSSFLISLAEQIIHDTIPGRADHKAWQALHRTMLSLHTYYDRNLKYPGEYEKAADLGEWWDKAA